MANVTDKVALIRGAILGKDVRESLATGIEAINTEIVSTTLKQIGLETSFNGLIINAGSSNAEIVDARLGELTLKTKLQKVDSSLANMTTQVDAIDRGIGGTKADLATIQALPPDTLRYVDGSTGLWYWHNGTSWVSGGTFQGIGIADGSITLEKTTLKYNIWGNYFNAEAITVDKYMTSAGAIAVLADFVLTDYIAVTSGQRIIDHYYDGATRIQGTFRFMCAFDAGKNVIAGGFDSERTYCDVPVGASFIRVTIRAIQNVQLVIEPTTTDLSYKERLFDLSENSYGLKSRMLAVETYTQNKLVVTVDAKGNGDYLTPQDALNNIDDSVINPVTIMVYPGIYIESLVLVQRYITLIGIDRDSCIIKNYLNDYYHPPIDLGANSHLKNLTIISDSNETTPPLGVDNLKSYGVHLDVSGRYTGDDLVGEVNIENCKCVSVYAHGIGLGTHPDCTYRIKNCELESKSGVTGGFRAHNYLYTGTNQKLIVDNCRIHNALNYPPIILQDSNHDTGSADNVDTVFSFRNTVAWNDSGTNIVASVATPQSGCVSGYIKLGVDSYNNNIANLNRV